MHTQINSFEFNPRVASVRLFTLYTHFIMQLERTVKYETKKIVMANPTNDSLIDKLLPIWSGRELDKKEILEILEESEGDTDHRDVCTGK